MRGQRRVPAGCAPRPAHSRSPTHLPATSPTSMAGSWSSPLSRTASGPAPGLPSTRWPPAFVDAAAPDPCSTVAKVGADLSTAPIDWAAAIRAGQVLAPTGPAAQAGEAAQVVSDLRAFSARAELAVRDTTGLGHGLPVDDADVVDRPGWVRATAQGMELLAAPLVDKLARSTAKKPGTFGRNVAGSQVGFILGFLSGKVLGQFDPLGGDPDRPGRLLLVAPNIVKVERELDADPTDFRLWVCLHESTHRLQFTAVPWLRDYFRELVGEFADKADTDPSELLKRAVAAISGKQAGREVATKGSGTKDKMSWIEGIQSPEQRLVFDRLMAL